MDMDATISRLTSRIYALEEQISTMKDELARCKLDSARLTCNGAVLSQILEEKGLVSQSEFIEGDLPGRYPDTSRRRRRTGLQFKKKAGCGQASRRSYYHARVYDK